MRSECDGLRLHMPRASRPPQFGRRAGSGGAARARALARSHVYRRSIKVRGYSAGTSRSACAALALRRTSAANASPRCVPGWGTLPQCMRSARRGMRPGASPATAAAAATRPCLPALPSRPLNHNEAGRQCAAIPVARGLPRDGGCRDGTEEREGLGGVGLRQCTAVELAACCLRPLFQQPLPTSLAQHEIVPATLVDTIAGLKHGGTFKCLKHLLRNKLVHHDSSK